MAWVALMAAAEKERQKNNLRLQRRILRDSSQPLELPGAEFIANFRFSKDLFKSLCRELGPLLSSMSRRQAIPAELKVLAALAFYANGSYQKAVGAYYHLGLSQPAVHKCIRDVTHALNHPGILSKYICFPKTREERETLMERFMEAFNFPGVVGCVDGTQVAIIRPMQHEEAFFNRKNYHSLNVMLICDVDLQILHVDASFGGACHDSHIWNQSPVKAHLENLQSAGETCWLLGDSGYAQRPWLMTPILNAVPDTPEEYYTMQHCRVRNTVERCIGVLKSRWRCLLAHRVLHYNPVKAGKIVNACCVLHNMINDKHFTVTEAIDNDFHHEINKEVVIGQDRSSRDDLVARLWTMPRSN